MKEYFIEQTIIFSSSLVCFFITTMIVRIHNFLISLVSLIIQLIILFFFLLIFDVFFEIREIINTRRKEFRSKRGFDSHAISRITILEQRISSWKTFVYACFFHRYWNLDSRRVTGSHNKYIRLLSYACDVRSHLTDFAYPMQISPLLLSTNWNWYFILLHNVNLLMHAIK